MVASSPKAETVRADRLRVVALGLNTWVVCVVAPMLGGASARNGLSIAAAVLIPVVLAIGTSLLGAHRSMSTWLLLGVVPCSAALGHSTLGLGRETALATTLLGAVTLLGYLAGTSLAVMRPTILREVEHRPIPPQAAVETHARRRHLQLGVLGIVAVPLLVYVIWIPLHDQARTERDEAVRLLTAVAACAATCGALTLFVGPAFRASRKRAPSSRPWLLWASLFTAAVFGATYLASR